MTRRPHRLLIALFVALTGAAGLMAEPRPPRPAPWTAASGLVLHGTVVTMDAARTTIEDGRILVRNGRIQAVWRGDDVPDGVIVEGAPTVGAGENLLIYPGLINLHDHPAYSPIPLWTPPASHVQAERGRPTGREAYGNRYDWNILSSTSPPEYLRLVANPNGILTNPDALNLMTEVVKYAEVKALLGGTTALQGAGASATTDGLLVRNVDNVNFGRDRIDNRVPSIGTLTGTALSSVLTRMRSGQLDAWLVHLAEGVRDGDRAPGDSTSSRAEFDVLRSKGLLGDATVIVHGTGLEAADFAAMAAAPTLRTDGRGDGLGAKLVWSPLSNMLLYGRTADVYEALAAGVTVSLGTDWSPSGSPNLLTELKIADRVLREPSALGLSRERVSWLAVDGVTGHERRAAERRLDQILVEMVTTNPARTLRWDQEVGSIEAGKVADILVIRQPHAHKRADVPKSAYRSLIDATEGDVRLVLVDGEPLAGSLALLSALKPGDHQAVPGTGSAIDTTRAGVPRGDQTLLTIVGAIDTALTALGGDHPPAGGGQADNSNTYRYLKANFRGTAGLTDAQFRSLVLVPFFGVSGGRLNLEQMARAPLVTASDDWLASVLDTRLDAEGLIAAPAPPYKRYPANFNHARVVNPFEARTFWERWILPR